jgi:hypothetical protein
MIKFIRKLFFHLPSTEKRRQERRVKTYELMLDHQVRDLSIKLSATEEKLQILQGSKNDLFTHLSHVSSLQHQFIEACQLEHQYEEFAEIARTEKAGEAV